MTKDEARNSVIKAICKQDPEIGEYKPLLRKCFDAGVEFAKREERDAVRAFIDEVRMLVFVNPIGWPSAVHEVFNERYGEEA